ncbi:hypothetical protein D1AOALGA4SA_8019 [Olavius algarvensis Delta 1 endosymbiont]|nr:hypothetical protein D1AOALGA4SA_8019 [Olavius algarvensis Delta 1 endosymbiont]
MSGVRCQMTEVRRQMTEIREQNTLFVVRCWKFDVNEFLFRFD